MHITANNDGRLQCVAGITLNRQTSLPISSTRQASRSSTRACAKGSGVRSSRAVRSDQAISHPSLHQTEMECERRFPWCGGSFYRISNPLSSTHELKRQLQSRPLAIAGFEDVVPYPPCITLNGSIAWTQPQAEQEQETDTLFVPQDLVLPGSLDSIGSRTGAAS